MPAALPLMPRLISRCLVPCLALCGLLLAAGARAEPLAEILSSGEQSAAAGQAAQAEVDRLATATRALLEEYKSVSRQIEGLGIHNACIRTSSAGWPSSTLPARGRSRCSARSLRCSRA